MKTTACAFCVLCALTGTLFAADAPAPKAWTVMVYIAGDNNLGEAGLKDVNEMETVGTTDRLNIVVQIDGSKEYTPDSPGTRRYLVQKDDKADQITSPEQGQLAEADMGSQTTLENFVTWAVDTYPAERYAIILWNHGNGWYPDDGLHKFNGGSGRGGPMDPLKAICSDESSDNALSTTGVGDVMERIAAKLGKRIDLVGFDACLMGMAESFYELRNAAMVACGSEKTEPGDGWPYDQWLAILAAHPDYDGEQLGRAIVETYTASYGENGAQGANNVTQACVRFEESAVKNFEAAVELFAGELNRVVEADPDGVKVAIEATQDFRVRSFFGTYFSTHRDLYDFAKKMKAQFPNDGDLAAGADLMMEAIADERGLVVANGVTDVAPYGSCKDAHGVAIYLPVDGYEGTYKTLDFASTGWLGFLDKLNGGTVLDGPPTRALGIDKAQLCGALYDVD